MLGINITSFNKQVTEFYNMEPSKTAGADLPGFLVNEQGYIHLPMMDSIFVKNKTIVEIQEQLQRNIRAQVSDALVIVNLINFKITFLGEVKSPGIVTTTNEEPTLFEAIALAGDLTEFANREKITIVRDKGKSFEIVTVNINKRDFLSSPELYIQPNDVIYVEPLKTKVFRANLSQVSLFLGFASLIIFVLTFLRR
jgi:polysaccharide export outer membrane protein